MTAPPPAPMLAVPGPLPTGPGWAYELKWDGVRALAVIDGGTVRFHARSGVDVTVAYPELAGLGGGPDATVLDGELVALDPAGRPSFQAIAERMHVRDAARAARLAATVPVTYLAFDALRLGGTDLLDTPYARRRALLEGIVPQAGAVSPAAAVSPAFAAFAASRAFVVPPAFDDGPATMAASREHGLEGVVAKRLASVYRPGTRSPAWIKVKLEETADFVVGGWRPGARAVGALLVGVPAPAPPIATMAGGSAPPGGLVFRGRVGGGISAAAERDLLRVLRPLVTTVPTFGSTIPREDARAAIWARPEVVVEVRYASRTRDNRLRFPRLLRLRPDKPPGEVVDD